MDGLSIELTNACNRRCLHCIRNRADRLEFFPLELAREILPQARALGFQSVCLTGGEAALYPHLEELLALLVDQGFTFNLVTNGYRFRDNLLPLLGTPKIRDNLTEVCLSLDGARPETHDALRGEGSFREVVEAATLCQLKQIPVSLKSVITNFNKGEITELALLGAALDSREHGFLHPFPAPRAIAGEVLPPPAEVREILEWIIHSLAKALRPTIRLEAFGQRTALFSCGNIQQSANLDFQGNLVLCCNLSHVAREEGEPSVFGREWLADLKEVSLREGLIRHFHGVARLMEARLRDLEKLKDPTFIPCYWCFLHFGKLEWLRGYPRSPWSAGVLDEEVSFAHA
jgi:MoaA/NifB/PqqE/SkfB family radical SAM enzyme